jgi:hypothetical protein
LTAVSDRAAYALYGLVKHDADGQRVLAPINGFVYMARFMRAGLQRREVPRERWVKGENDDHEPAATVRCLCDAQTIVPAAAFPTRCRCERWFFFDGCDVWSLR